MLHLSGKARRTCALTGHEAYQSGFLDHRGGDLDPLKFSQGLAEAARKAGAVIHGNSRVVGLRRAGGTWHIETQNGATLQASSVLVCCNGYTDGLLYTLYGYNGRGVALSTSLGKPLAELLSGNITAEDMPVPPTDMKPIAFHRFWPIGVHAAIGWSRLKNAMRR